MKIIARKHFSLFVVFEIDYHLYLNKLKKQRIKNKF